MFYNWSTSPRIPVAQYNIRPKKLWAYRFEYARV